MPARLSAGRMTGSPSVASQRCTVRTPLPRKFAISFHDVRSSNRVDEGVCRISHPPVVAMLLPNRVRALLRLIWSTKIWLLKSREFVHSLGYLGSGFCTSDPAEVPPESYGSSRHGGHRRVGRRVGSAATVTGGVAGKPGRRGSRGIAHLQSRRQCSAQYSGPRGPAARNTPERWCTYS